MTPPQADKNIKFKYNIRVIVLLLISSILLFGGFNVIYYAMFLVENRPGALLFDPVHHVLPAPMNFSNLIFMATYSGVFVIAIDCLMIGLAQLSKVMLGYTLIVLLRSASMVLVPLDPPVGLIPLTDPLIAFFNPEPFVATRDLFFSGHCATLAFFYFIARQKHIRYFLGFLNLFVIITLSLQRVHYTIDIIGGIMAAYGVYKLIEQFFVKIIYPFLSKSPIPELRFSKKSLTKK